MCKRIKKAKVLGFRKRKRREDVFVGGGKNLRSLPVLGDVKSEDGTQTEREREGGKERVRQIE